QRVRPGQEVGVEVIIHSHYPERTRFEVRPALPEGWEFEPGQWHEELEEGEEACFTVAFRVPDDAPARTHIISADLTAGDWRWGEFFDARVDVIPEGTEAPKWYDRVKT
ncbi:MAG TPA: NEW3 domain-containing protein, partial [Armatimonadota bacterium]|nr:NEW3 domain-containing protein [Armatimonadota bacterium]